MNNLQDCFTADAENVHSLVEDNHPLILVCFLRIFEVFLSQVWQQSVQYSVTVPSSFVGYSNKFFL